MKTLKKFELNMLFFSLINETIVLLHGLKPFYRYRHTITSVALKGLKPVSKTHKMNNRYII